MSKRRWRQSARLALKKFPLESPETPLYVRVGEYEGNVRRASDNVLAVVFSARSAPPVRIGAKVDLYFMNGGLVHGKQTSGRVLSWHDQGDYRQIQIRVLPEIFCLVCAGMGMRDDFRVTPNPARRLTANIRARGRSEWSRTLLKDVSASGVGVLVGSETDERLVDVALVEIEIEFPGDEESTRFVGRIRYRGMNGCSIKHGIEIDAGLTLNFEHVDERIRTYVMERQREILSNSRGLGYDPPAA